MSKQETATNVKARLSVPALLLLLHTVVCTAAMIAIMQEGKEQLVVQRHHCPHCLRPLSLHTVIHATAMIAIAQEGKEWPIIPRHCCLHSRHHRHCAPFFSLLLLLLLRERVSNSQQCRHGTLFCSTPIVAIVGAGKGQPTTVPRHHLPLCHRRLHPPSSMLLLLTESQEQARNGQQCQSTVAHAAATVIIMH